MLYPREDKQTSKLMFACRTCQYSEEAQSSCVFRNNLYNTVGETAGVTQDVGSDPTVGSSPDSLDLRSLGHQVPNDPCDLFCTMCGKELELFCTVCGEELEVCELSVGGEHGVADGEHKGATGSRTTNIIMEQLSAMDEEDEMDGEPDTTDLDFHEPRSQDPDDSKGTEQAPQH